MMPYKIDTELLSKGLEEMLKSQINRMSNALDNWQKRPGDVEDTVKGYFLLRKIGKMFCRYEEIVKEYDDLVKRDYEQRLNQMGIKLDWERSK